MTPDYARIWINTANAVVLRDNNSKWRKFFTSQYKTPLDCIENIPDITTQSIATIVEYYFVFYPRLQYQKRIWINTANAVVLRDSNSKWKKFFTSQFKTPFDCIENIPDTATQSITTIIQYYLIFHQHLMRRRMWVEIANAVVLRNSDSIWEKFFATDFKDPIECIKAIPDESHLSVTTAVTYYCIFHSDCNTTAWTHTPSALVFIEKNPELILSDTFGRWEVVVLLRKQYKLPTDNTIHIYFRFIDDFDVSIDFIKKYGNVLPQLIKDHQIAMWLKQEFDENNTISSIVKKYKKNFATQKISNVKQFIEIVKRYYDLELFDRILM